MHERKAPSLTHRPDQTANPTISFSSVPAQLWIPNRGKQMDAPSFLEKRDRRERRFFIEKSSQCTQISPSRTSCACSSPKRKTQRLCVSSGVKLRVSTHFLNTLLVLAMIIDRKPYSFQNARFKQSSQ